MLFYFSSNISEFIRLPFISGQGDYAPVHQDPIQFLHAMWVPWLLIAFPLAALVLRITEASLREDLQEDFIRTARAKGLSERRVINRHALPVAGPAIAAMTGVNVSTMLINVAVIEVRLRPPRDLPRDQQRGPRAGGHSGPAGAGARGRGADRRSPTPSWTWSSTGSIRACAADQAGAASARHAQLDPGSTHECACALDVLRAAAQRDRPQRVPVEAVLAADVAPAASRS